MFTARFIELKLLELKISDIYYYHKYKEFKKAR